MPVSYEVSAVFAMEDRAGATLSRIIEQLDRLDGTIARVQGAFARLGDAIGLGKLNEALDSTDGTLLRLQGVAERAAAGLNAAFTASVAHVDDLTAALDRADTAAARINAAGVAGLAVAGPRERGGGDGAPSEAGVIEGAAGGAVARSMAHRYGHQLAGGMMDLAFNPVTLVEAFAVEKAFGSAMATDLSLAQTASALGFDPNTPAGQAAVRQLQQSALAASVGTIYSERQTAAAMVPFAQVAGTAFAGTTPEERMRQMATVFPLALRQAEVAQQMGLGDLTSNVEAAVGFAHLSRHYDPRSLGASLDELMRVSMTTHMAPAQLLRTMKYGLPSGELAGIDPDTLIAATGFLLQSGMTGTTAGTSMSQMILGVLKGGGALTGHLAHTRDELEHSLKLAPDTRHAMQGSQHEAALRRMGIEDAAGHLTVMDRAGHLDLMKVIADVEAFIAAHANDRQLVANTMYYGFGLRGERGMAAFATPEGQEQFQRYISRLPGMPGVAALQGMMAARPEQQMEQAWAGLSNVINEMLTPTLALLGHAAADAAAGLNSIADFLHTHTSVARIAGGGAVGAAAGAAIGAVGGLVVAGPPGAVAGGLYGALYGAGGGAALGAAASLPAPTPSTARPGFPAPIHYGAPPKVDVQVNVTGGDGDPGFAERVRRSLEAYFTGDFADALAHSTGVGNGSYMSPSLAGPP